jgi:hypothetical protein
MYKRSHIYYKIDDSLEFGSMEDFLVRNAYIPVATNKSRVVGHRTRYKYVRMLRNMKKSKPRLQDVKRKMYWSIDISLRDYRIPK